MELDVLHEGVRVGDAEIGKDGLYWKIDAVCSMFDADVHRLWAHETNTSVPLGVLIPDGKGLALRKKVPVSAFCFTEKTVITTEEMQLPLFAETVADHAVEGAYLLEKNGRRTLCIPYRNEPFSLIEFVCFFRLERLDGRLFWMTELDERNFPVFC